MTEFKSGFIAIVGRPNVGKSSLLNRLIGQKIAIISPKPQTTRNTIRGILHGDNYQIVFIDTPGIHNPENKLGEAMQKNAYQGLRDNDAILYLVDAKPFLDETDLELIKRLKACKCKIFLGINKIDLLTDKSAIDRIIMMYLAHLEFQAVVPISVREDKNIEHLLKEVVEVLEPGPAYFPEDTVTDQPERAIIAEVVREKIMLYTKEEIPYSVIVVTEELKKNIETGQMQARIQIYGERESQKGIIIGKHGAMLKKIGTAARKDLNAIFDNKFHLELWVKIKKDWRKSIADLKNFGFYE